MKKVTKKEMVILAKARIKQHDALTMAKNLCVAILKKNDNKIEFPRNLITIENPVNVYGKYGSVEECKFAGATMVFDELCVYGLSDDRDKIELIGPSWYDENELIWIAGYLIDYLNGDIVPNNEEE